MLLLDIPGIQKDVTDNFRYINQINQINQIQQFINQSKNRNYENYRQ